MHMWKQNGGGNTANASWDSPHKAVNLAPRAMEEFGDDMGSTYPLNLATMGMAPSPSNGGLANVFSGVANLARNVSRDAFQKLAADDPSRVTKDDQFFGLVRRSSNGGGGSGSGGGGGSTGDRFDLRRNRSMAAGLSQGSERRSSDGGGGGGKKRVQFDLRRNKSMGVGPSCGLEKRMPSGGGGDTCGQFDLRHNRSTSTAGSSSHDLDRRPSGGSNGSARAKRGDFTDAPGEGGGSGASKNAEWGDFITAQGSVDPRLEPQRFLPPQHQRSMMPCRTSGKLDKENVQMLTRTADDAYHVAASLLQRKKQKAQRSTSGSGVAGTAAAQQGQVKSVPPLPSPKTIRGALADSGEIMDLLNKIKTKSVEMDSSHRVYNSFERPSESEDQTESAAGSTAPTSRDWSVQQRQVSSSSSAKMRRTASMYQRPCRAAGSSAAVADPYGVGRRRIQSEAALRRSRSNSGAVKSILLEARYSNSSLCSMNSTNSPPGTGRPRKRASVKFTAPTIHHIATLSLDEGVQAEIFDDSFRNSSVGETSPRTVAVTLDAKKSKAPSLPIVTPSVDAPNSGEGEGKATPKSKKENKDPKEQGTSSTNAKEDDYAAKMKELRAFDIKADVPMSMKDFLEYMSDRTVMLQQMRRGDKGLQRRQSFSEGQLLEEFQVRRPAPRSQTPKSRGDEELSLEQQQQQRRRQTAERRYSVMKKSQSFYG